MMNDSPISLETNKKLNISSVLWHQPAAVCSRLDQVFHVQHAAAAAHIQTLSSVSHRTTEMTQICSSGTLQTCRVSQRRPLVVK